MHRTPPTQHPEAGEGPRSRDPYDLLVIGAGPAGLVAARSAAAAGARVALIESRQLGGNCLHQGCIPSKTIIRSAQLIAEMRNGPNFGIGAPADVTVDFPAIMVRLRRVRDRIQRLDSASRLRAAGIDLHVGHARFVSADAVEVNGTRLRFKKALIATGSHPPAA
ncbi:FAD-dependent oxidoreductase [uncultured Thiodictyon sp.]|uniref:FAD-dependent oxidoreductase n=1 Tax=uncultured Thiodictyon sp. TaxID=1846217 RepID=UPI0025E50A46|nr:FAD-dependent oxidoreductase [uncultured Thiodictyon sp.]